MNVARDGSLYTGWCLKDHEPPHRLIPEQLPDGSVRFEWDRAEPIDASARREKTSFHASGVTLSSGGRSIGVNLKLLTHRTYLCTYFPRHPQHWPIVATVRRRDMLIRDLIGDDCPLMVQLYYQPAGTLPMLGSHLENGIFVAPVGFDGIEQHGRVLLQLAFIRQPSAVKWAPRCVIAYPSVSEATAPLDAERWFEPG